MRIDEAQDIEELASLLEATSSLATLVDEMVVESVLQDYSLHTPPPIDKLLQNEEYIRGVLGIDIPLNESYPYSAELQERILEEQLLLEGFFADAKALGGDLKKGALALRYVVEDPGRIKSFMSSVYETVIKDPMEKIIAFCKRILNIVVTQAESLAVKGWEAVKKFFTSMLEKLEGLWKGVQGLSGWKGALAVVGLGASIAFIFSEEMEGVIDKLDNPLKELKKLGKQAKKESFTPVPSSLLNEGEDGASSAEPEKKQKTLLKKIIDLLTKGLIAGVKKWVKGLAMDFLQSAVGGGIVTFVKTIGKVFGGAKYVAKVIGKATDKFISKIKNPKEEMEEMEKGEDDPTEATWHDDEKLIREYVRLKLLAAS